MQPVTPLSTGAAARSRGSSDHGPADRIIVPRRERARTSLNERLGRASPTVWLSGQEAAEYVGVSWPTLRQFIRDHAVPHVRLGTRWKIEVAVLDDHLRRMANVHAEQG